VVRPRTRGAVPIVAGCLAAIALLAVPVSDSVAIVREHRFDHSTGGGYLSATEAAALSRYLGGHRHGERYEAALLTVWQASSLIVIDRRPVLVTRNVDGAPMMSVADLREEVQRGQVHYVVAGTPCMKSLRAASRDGPGKQSPCPPASRWAQLHGNLVPGVVPGLGLYRLGGAG